MLKVASLKPDRPTFETESLLFFLLAVRTPKLDDFLLMTPSTLHIVVLFSLDVHHHVISLTFHDHWTLFVTTHCLAVVKTLHTQTSVTVLVIDVLLAQLPTSHTTIVSTLPQGFRGVTSHLVLINAGIVSLNVQNFALQTVSFVTVRTFLGTFPLTKAGTANIDLMVLIAIDQLDPTCTVSADIGYKFSWFGLVKVVG